LTVEFGDQGVYLRLTSGPDAAECEKDHHRRRRPAAGGNGQVTQTADAAGRA
jgi:hypothetical protein